MCQHAPQAVAILEEDVSFGTAGLTDHTLAALQLLLEPPTPANVVVCRGGGEKSDGVVGGL